MTKIAWNSLGAALCVCLLTTVAAAANKPAESSQNVKAKAENSMRSAWPPETLSGKIIMVDPAEKLVVVKAADGIPFDLRVTPSTRITAAGQKLSFKELSPDVKKDVSVRFIPERAGDVARSIQVTG